MATFDGTDDVFDSREVIERIAELEAIEIIDREPENRDELDALYELAEEAEGYIPDFQYGETFIHADYFTEYAMEMISDIGYLPADLPWWIIIDKQATADNMKEDYTEFTFRGSTYYAR